MNSLKKLFASFLVALTTFQINVAYAVTDAACHDNDPLTVCTSQVIDTSGPLAVIADNWVPLSLLGAALIGLALFVRASTKPKYMG